jgi:transcriptional regulator with XRE-family HTH domain
MSQISDSAVFDEFLDDQFETEEERAAFERKVAKLVATSDLLNALDQARRAVGVSKAEVARRVGSKRSVVSRLLSGRGANPKVETIADIADALGVYLDIRVKPQPRSKRHATIEVHQAVKVMAPDRVEEAAAA